ncbi:hypothetical protein ACFOQM_16460 [Paenibacillus sp. GCM10012307]|uniref:Uncharacterized protein n=1 Tax=Paenibacillus roseus TaxID=2798579 RepID=A0A934J103_9BACL|nr:hypothetical protein [Paenibacillus roseus]MBJ6362837.1 hypothetical protein [Paenibacillus roseus]
MTFLDAKQRYFSKKDERLPHLIVDAFLSKAPDEAIEDVIAKPYAELNRNAVAEMGPLHILSVTSHGMSDLIHLNSDYICGKSPYLGIEPYINPHRLPSCMDHNGFCFFKKTGDALKAFEIKAKHVFVNSCGSLQFKQATFDPLFNVGYSFLEGHACSFVGALRWKDGYGSESVLFYQLLKNGYTLGEAVAILNDTLYSNQFEHSKNVFCLIGDPESALLQSEKAEYDTAHYDDKSKAIHLKFNAGFAHVKVESRLFVDVFMRQRMLLHVKALKETYFISAVPTKEKNALHLFVYSNGNIHGDQLLNIEDVSALFDNLLYVYRNVDQNLNNTLGLNKLYPNWIKQGGKKNIENRLLNVSRLLKECFIHHHQFPKFRKSSHMFFQEVDKLNFDIAKTLYESISRTSFRFSEYYQESFVLQPDHSPEDCYLCGKTLASRTLVHILQPNIKRTETICSSCGGLEDKPDHDLSLQLKLQESFTKASNNNVVLQLKNSTEKVFDGYCVLAVRRSSELGIGSGEPIKKILLQPHETKEVDFELVVESDVPIHQYALQTAFISMTQIYLSGRSIWVH